MTRREALEKMVSILGHIRVRKDGSRSVVGPYKRGLRKTAGLFSVSPGAIAAGALKGTGGGLVRGAIGHGIGALIKKTTGGIPVSAPTTELGKKLFDNRLPLIYGGNAALGLGFGAHDAYKAEMARVLRNKVLATGGVGLGGAALLSSNKGN